MNQVVLIGNISTPIEMRYTPNGHAVAKFNLAVNNPYNRDDVSFVPIETWRKTAENTATHCDKGSKVGIVGELKVEQYEKDGQKRTFTKVVAQTVEFLTPKSSGSKSQDNTGNQGGGYADPFGGGPVDISDDSLPF